MAGYFIYSLDGGKFQQFVTAPDEKTLTDFADLISQEIDESYDEFSKDDPILDWPAEPEELVPILKERLAQKDWYGGLSDAGKSMWERALQDLCMDDVDLLGFDVDSDGVYWDVIDLIRSHHGIEPDAVTELEISHFGLRPYRYVPDNSKKADFYAWHPNHSMHTPDEVGPLLEQIKAAESAVRNSGDENAIEEYEEELVPALESIAEKKRVLFIGVDT